VIKVLVLTRYDRLGSSSRVRFLDFLPSLENHGFVFSVCPFFNNEYLLSRYRKEPVSIGNVISRYLLRLKTLLHKKSFDLLWIEKEVLPWFPVGIEQFLLGDAPFVLDLDDAWFERYDRNSSAIVRNLLGGKIFRLMRLARTVVAGNEYLSEQALKAGASRAEVIPSVVNLDRYPRQSLDRGETSPVIIGWIGSPVTVGYLNVCEPALRSLSLSKNIEVHVVGAVLPSSFNGLLAKSIPWSEDTEIDEIRRFHIGIMPLHDTSWEKGKCGYKLIQAMAAGLPVVASAVGVNRSLVRDGDNGFLAATSADWLKALTQLVEDPVLRNRLGLAGRQLVEERYNTRVVVPRLAAVLREAIR
jgi:glycosyltransferase involved in cell wall biosynthesis